MPLDRHAKRILDMMAARGLSARSTPDPLEMRQAMVRLSEVVDARDVPMACIEERKVPGRERPLTLRVYLPTPPAHEASPALIYFHGGAGVSGSLDTHDGLCRILAASSNCRVLSVDYRLAPEHPFPAAVEDSYVATRWICSHAIELGLDAARIGVGGDSHGGTLAAVVCQQSRQGGPALALQLLICPVLDLAGETESRRAFAKGYFLDSDLLEEAVRLYCPAGLDRTDPRISPLHARDLTGLPPAYVHTAEFDPMRDEGEAYARALRRAGVRVHSVRHPGMIHHFYAMAGAIPYARTAIEAAGGAIKGALARC